MEASKKTGKEPFLRTVKRAELSRKKTMILRVASVLLALVAGGIFLLIYRFPKAFFILYSIYNSKSLINFPLM